MDENRVIENRSYPAVPVVRRKEYELCFEQFGMNTFFHCRVLAKWTPALRRAFARDVDTLFALHGGPILVYCASHNKKLRKFAVMHGCEHARFINTGDGQTAEILIRKQ